MEASVVQKFLYEVRDNFLLLSPQVQNFLARADVYGPKLADDPAFVGGESLKIEWGKDFWDADFAQNFESIDITLDVKKLLAILLDD